MGRGLHCTVSEREEMKRWRAEGKSLSQIAQIMQCSKKKVHSALNFVEKAESRGRKRATSARWDKSLIRLSKKNPFFSSTKLKNELEAPVSSRTVRNRLLEEGLKGRSARRVPLLSKQNIKKRLDFARKYLGRENWANVLWSDETKINMFGSDGKQFVRRPDSTAFDPKYTQKTVKHGGGSIMIWGCFSSSGVGPIHWIREIMCAADYVNIMQNTMLPYAEENMPLRWELQQDNDPKHNSKLAKQWFAVNKVPLMEWPSQSPDLNPIEHLWGVLKRKIGDFKAKNREDLWQKIQQEWYSIDQDLCKRLVDSMNSRCKEVLQNKGGATKY